MNRIHQILFSFSVIGICWLSMMAVHEMGHVLGAVISGGEVQRVVLYPLSISRTDVEPNPNPLLVVWAGPIVGCVVPIVLSLLLPRQLELVKAIGSFFAGFCLIANGAYISFGAIDQVGDCKEMLQHGSPLAVLVLFGIVATIAGFTFWHRIGSPVEFFRNPDRFSAKESIPAVVTMASLVTVFALLPAN